MLRRLGHELVIILFYTSFLLHFQTWGAEPEIDRLEGDTVYFKAGTTGQAGIAPLKTGLFDIKALGWLTPRGEASSTIAAGAAPGGSSHLVIGAKPCDSCLQDRAIYLFRVGGRGKPAQFVYPGKILEPKTRAVMIESRAFFGKCLKNNANDVYVVFQRERVDRRRSLQASVFIAEPQNDFISEKLLERNLPNINSTLKLSKGKNSTCKEIEGRNRVMPSRALDLMVRHGEGNTEEDND